MEVSYDEVGRADQLVQLELFVLLDQVIFHGNDPDPKLVKMLLSRVHDVRLDKRERLLNWHLSLILFADLRVDIGVRNGHESEQCERQ